MRAPRHKHRYRKEKRMKLSINLEDIPYDAMGDYSVFRFEVRNSKAPPDNREKREKSRPHDRSYGSGERRYEAAPGESL